MSEREHQQQKLKGARLIIEKMRDIADKSNIEITKIKWDDGKLITDREDFHTLEVFSDDKSIQKIFYVEEIADFPYESKDTINKIRDMIRQLKV